MKTLSEGGWKALRSEVTKLARAHKAAMAELREELAHGGIRVGPRRYGLRTILIHQYTVRAHKRLIISRVDHRPLSLTEKIRRMAKAME